MRIFICLVVFAFLIEANGRDDEGTEGDAQNVQKEHDNKVQIKKDKQPHQSNNEAKPPPSPNSKKRRTKGSGKQGVGMNHPKQKSKGRSFMKLIPKSKLKNSTMPQKQNQEKGSKSEPMKDDPNGKNKWGHLSRSMPKNMNETTTKKPTKPKGKSVQKEKKKETNGTKPTVKPKQGGKSVNGTTTTTTVNPRGRAFLRKKNQYVSQS